MNGLIAEAGRGGINPDKAQALLEIYKNTPVGSNGRPREPQLSNAASIALRGFLVNHARLLSGHADFLGQYWWLDRIDREKVRAMELAAPVGAEEGFRDTTTAVPGYNLPANKPVEVKADPRSLRLHLAGGGTSLTVAGSNFSLELKAPQGRRLQAGDTYEVPPETSWGGYVTTTKFGKFKIHELVADPHTGNITRAVITWVGQAEYRSPLGLVSGQLVVGSERR